MYAHDAQFFAAVDAIDKMKRGSQAIVVTKKLAAPQKKLSKPEEQIGPMKKRPKPKR